MSHASQSQHAPTNGKPRFGETIRRFVRLESFAGLVLLAATVLATGQEPPMQQLIHALHPWVAFAILPIFAFMNAGIAFANMDPQLAFGSVPMGIFLTLAFAEGGAGYALTDRLGILAGSLLSGVVGYLVLRFARPGPAA